MAGWSYFSIPSNKDSGFSTDYEVVKLKTTTSDGHRLVTLRLRTSPEVKGRDRRDYTFVFDADDLFVVRSGTGGSSASRSRSDTITTTREDARSSGPSPRRASIQPRRSGRRSLRSRNAASARFRNPSSPSNRSWPASSPAGSSGSRSKNPRLRRSSTGTGWRSSAAGSAWPVGPAWPWEADAATDGPCGRNEKDVASVSRSTGLRSPAQSALRPRRAKRGTSTRSSSSPSWRIHMIEPCSCSAVEDRPNPASLLLFASPGAISLT